MSYMVLQFTHIYSRNRKLKQCPKNKGKINFLTFMPKKAWEKYMDIFGFSTEFIMSLYISQNVKVTLRASLLGFTEIWFIHIHVHCLKSVTYICLDYIIISRRQERKEINKKRITPALMANSFLTLTFVGRRNEQIHDDCKQYNSGKI